MDIVVRRSGGVTGMTRTWRADTAVVDDTADWDAVVATLPDRAPTAPAPKVRDDFVWTITIDRISVTVPGSQLEEPLSSLVRKVTEPA